MALSEFARLRLLETDEAQNAPFREFGTPEEEAADEAAWAERFAKSGDLLDRLAAEAREDRRQGRTVPLEDLLDRSA